MDLAVSVESAFSPMILRRFNTWYSINDGNWSDPNTWMGNALDKKLYTSPQPGDNVYINHTVTLDTTVAVNNLYISGTLKADNSSRVLTVNGDLQAVGAVDFTSSNVGLILNGVNNYVVSFTCGAASTVCYNSSMTQAIMPVTYFNLEIFGGENLTKYLQANLSVNGHLYLGVILDTNNFNMTINGVITNNGIGIAGNRRAATIISTANITCIGAVQAGIGLSFTIIGAASVECQAGISVSNGWCSWPTANVNFTTNSQTISGGGSGNGMLTCNNITITGAITVNTSASALEALILNGVMNGTVAGSTFNNNGWLKLTNSTLPMATGVFNYNNNAASTMQYAFNGNYTLPYTSYNNLTIDGTGTKTASGHTTVAGALLFNNGVMDMAAYNLTVIGTTSIRSSTGALNKTGGGSMVFVGQIGCQIGSFLSSFSGNPTVEFRNGINHSNGTIDFGTGAISFTTNNQSINCGAGGNDIVFNGNVTIAAGITVTRVSDISNVIFNGVLNGASSTANFTNKGVVKYQNATAPMATGQLYCNQATNTFNYSLGGNQDITVPSDPTPGYSNLTLSTSGAKKLLGNVSVKGTYTLSAPATLNSNGFALTNP